MEMDVGTGRFSVLPLASSRTWYQPLRPYSAKTDDPTMHAYVVVMATHLVGSQEVGNGEGHAPYHVIPEGKGKSFTLHMCLLEGFHRMHAHTHTHRYAHMHARTWRQFAESILI